MAFPRPRPVAVKFGRPLAFSELRAQAKTCPKPRLKLIYQEVADELMRSIASLGPFEEVETFG